MNLQFRSDGLALEISGLQWLVRDCDGWSVGRYPDGRFLAIEPFPGATEIACYQDFSALIYGQTLEENVTVEPHNRVLREVAHVLGVTEIEGHPVDHWLRDEQEMYAEMEAERAKPGPRPVP